MKLWLLCQGINTDYDTYDSCVVAAETEDEARNTHPSGWHTSPIWDSTTWVSPKDIQIKYLGEAAVYINSGVVCASFNAG